MYNKKLFIGKLMFGISMGKNQMSFICLEEGFAYLNTLLSYCRSSKHRKEVLEAIRLQKDWHIDYTQLKYLSSDQEIKLAKKFWKEKTGYYSNGQLGYYITFSDYVAPDCCIPGLELKKIIKALEREVVEFDKQSWHLG